MNSSNPTDWMLVLNEEREGVSHDAATIKSCCADFYSHEWAELLLGGSFHPGGQATTDRLAELLDLQTGDRVLDIACGFGRTSIYLATQYGVAVSGVDLSAETIERAREEAAAAGASAEFFTGDAECLPFEDGAFDVVICECSFCLFPDKRTAATEIARVLRPGGRVGISDICREGQLPAELESLRGWVSCIADAYPTAAIAAEFGRAGLEIQRDERHDDALSEMIRDIGMRMMALEVVVKLGKLELPTGIGLDEAKRLRRLAAAAVESGQLGYALLTARKSMTSGYGA